ncbi:MULTISPECIES: PTS sugar transporter subunit IIC [Serratia]|uniref:Permease IIC component n=1 Tax=Serratia ficaria TaxID=61651 RepID=A0A240C5H9_SERFI|nr:MULTISPECIES: PTS transporter subunit EIIC [Serratia]REF44027.1 PTS system cellobiose-specific IIC component [Serratia ficaria]CAI0730708.1 PTS system oligo-beta-mannoside-specific EIIC component [Serratia ficaria]CAI0734749.1 PTS system oligo-beta-mannoside-specific EIIC component [Serratia ficaria]CAI0751149.1 PTS system oligo-beta-mannoside-specific EIIC component [Serratia ficaria]CAI0762940.1 PTS system oligo-beta-mannoside-specific EIIC component [Serratia ficaria]
MSFRDRLIDSLGAFANTFNSYRYIMAIKASFITLMPVIIVGAFSVLISNMVMDPKNGLASFAMFSFLADLKPIMSSINYATLSFLNIGAVFLIGIELGKINGSRSLFPGLLAVICFISVTPTTVELMVNNQMQLVKDVLAKQFSDTRSLFLGMFIAILSVEIYSKLETLDRLKIKMPESVPPNVSASFSALIPAIITVVAIATFGFVFHRLTGIYLYDAVYQVVQQPLETVVQSLPGILILMFVAQLFWVIGIHGNQMVKPIREPLLLGAIMVNMTAFEQGKDIPNIITMPFWDVYMSIGGSGITLGLLFAVMIATKRKEMREIGKLSLGPSFFNINEPVIFGMPIMLNPILAIPFIITPLITGTIGYFATSIGFAGKAVVMVPWTTPPIINAWLSTAGSMGAVITQLICIVVATLIYLPFVKVAARRAAQAEQPVIQNA